MGFNVPLLNRDSDWVANWIQTRVKEPQTQKRLVLVIVSVALLLDNMLYMVIVPIIPHYLRAIHAYEKTFEGYHNETHMVNGTFIVKPEGGHWEYADEDMQLGWLFASKALVQILINPFSGALIDRIGYEIPMILGLGVMFTSTAVFALGKSYGVLFFARSLQGLGSAFADTSGLAMIADRFTEETERSAALGIALAFISFGCLVAPPFGSVLYSMAGKPVPFLILSFICLLDGFAVFWVIQPKDRARDASGERVKGTPMHHLFRDPYVLICAGALVMANVSLAFLEPTITNWMSDTMPDTPKWMVGIIWLPAFAPHVLGVYVTVKLIARWPKYPWLFAAIGLAMEGIACIFVPFTTTIGQLILPLSFVCFGIALVDTALLPTLGMIVDTRHVSVYGSVYAIADISYSMAYAFGPIVAGWIVGNMGFLALNIIILVTNVGYAPGLCMLRKVYDYVAIGGGEQSTVPHTELKEENYGQINGNNGGATTALNGDYQSGGFAGGYGTAGGANDYAPVAAHNSNYDPLNPEW